jgi:hypothetical protein
LLMLLNVRMLLRVIEEFTKGIATSGSQKEPVNFFNLKFPFKHAVQNEITIAHITNIKNFEILCIGSVILL